MKKVISWDHVDASDTIVNLLFLSPIRIRRWFGNVNLRPGQTIKKRTQIIRSFSGKYYQEKDFKEVSRVPTAPMYFWVWSIPQLPFMV